MVTDLSTDHRRHRAEPAQGQSQPPVILVIDDSPTIRKMVECHLSQAGYRVAMAADAEQGSSWPSRSGPNLILLDHQLPGTTGDEVCRRLLESEATAQHPGRHQLGDAEPGVRPVHRVPQRRRPDPQAVHARAAQERRGQRAADRARWSSRPSGPAARCPRRSARSTRRPWKGAPRSSRSAPCSTSSTTASSAAGSRWRSGKDRIRFALAGGRIQAVFSPTIAADRLVRCLPRRPGRPGPAAGDDAGRAPGRLDGGPGQAAGAEPVRPAAAPRPCCGSSRPC